MAKNRKKIPNTTATYEIRPSGDFEITIKVPVEGLCARDKKNMLFGVVDVILDTINSIQEDIGLDPLIGDVRGK